MVACSNDTRPFDTAARMAVNLVSGVISKMDPGAGRRTSCTTAWRCAREKGVVFCVLCVACACAFVLSGATVVVTLWERLVGLSQPVCLSPGYNKL